MIRIFPSISLLDGKVAKLIDGDYKHIRLFDKSPLDLAKYFEDKGAEWLHIVDLDGANMQKVRNDQTLQVLSAHTNLKVSFSGGLRNSLDVSNVLKSGAKTVTMATLAVEKPDTFMDMLITYGRNRLILGADIKEGKIVTRGWQANTNINAWDHIQFFYDRSVQFVKITDVTRDGNLEGPNFELYKDAVERFPNMKIVASGGVRSMADVEKLNQMGIWGVIVARALYEDRIPIDELFRAFGGTAVA